MSGLAGAAWRMMLLRRVHPSSGILPEFWYFCLRPAQQCCTSLGQVFLLCRQGGAAEGQERCWGWLCRDGKALKRLGSLSFLCLVGVFVFPVPAVLPRDKMSLKGFPLALPVGRTQTSLARVLFCCTRLCYEKQNSLY